MVNPKLQFVLNDKQKQVVLADPCRNLLVLSCAGSGKTTMIIHRMAHLIAQGITTINNIMLITFTVEAAQTLERRLSAHLGIRINKQQTFIGTFHSVALRILRNHPYFSHLYDRQANFTIWSTVERGKVLIMLWRRYEQANDKFDDVKLENEFAHLKQLSLLVSYQKKADFAVRVRGAVPMHLQDMVDTAQRRYHYFAKLYQDYLAAQHNANVMDFDDIIQNCHFLLQEDSIRQKYQQLFRYICIDEFQDIDDVQYTWLTNFIHPTTYCMAVGDDDQSIYGFRGSNLICLQKFAHDFPQVQKIQLVQNYRSSTTILHAANAVIITNLGRLKNESLWTHNPPGGLIEKHAYASEHEEAVAVVEKIIKYKQEYPKLEIAVLSRTHERLRLFKASAREQKVVLHYKKSSEEDYLDEKQNTKKQPRPSALAFMVPYLQFLKDPTNEALLRQIINLPKRGLSDGVVAKMTQDGQNLLIALHQRYQKAIKPSQHMILFMQFLTWVERESTTASLMSIVEAILTVNSFEPPPSLAHFLTECIAKTETAVPVQTHTLAQRLNNFLAFFREEAQHEAKVFVSTIHGAKGLEFDCVFLIGLNDHLTAFLSPFISREVRENPVMLKKHFQKNALFIKEERRLFYVAITRTKHILHLSYLEQKKRLRFLDEIPPSTIEPVRRDDGEKELNPLQ